MTDTTQTAAPETSPTVMPIGGGRYSLDDAGQIFFQPDHTNPLPGTAVGTIAKGETMLAPTTDVEAARDWLAIHVRSVLEPLFLLKQEAGEGALPEGAPRDIGAKLYDHLGVMHRTDLEDEISKLDPETRKALRSKGVRLGPILAFLPALVKPAAIKMRALLWGVWNDKALPVARPTDGRVSEVVDTNTVDRNFYRMIGYPVFGPRAIRIDMLDRVITDIYDAAQSGVFEAKHKYAEWLGTNLDGLHAILEAMGHRKMKDEPVVAADVAPVIEGDATVEAVTTAEAAVDAPALEAIPVAEVSVPVEGAESARADGAASAPVESAEAKKATTTLTLPVKPVVPLVKFMLKRGKMSDVSRSKSAQHKKRDHSNRKPKKPAFDPNTPVMLTDEDKERIKQRSEERAKSREGNRDNHRDGGRDGGRKDQGGGERARKPKRDRDDGGRDAYRPKDRRNERTESNEGRVYTFEGAKKDGEDDGNPFAILKNLKK